MRISHFVPLLINCLRDSRRSGCTFGVGKPTLQSIVMVRSFCLRVFAFPFGALTGLFRANHPIPIQFITKYHFLWGLSRVGKGISRILFCVMIFGSRQKMFDMETTRCV